MDKLLPVLWPQPWWAIGPVGVIGWVLGLVTAVAAAGALMVFSISASEDYPPPAKLTARAVMAPVALAAAWALMNAQRIVSHFQHTARDRIVLGVLLGAGGLIVVAIVGCLVIGALSLLLLPFTAAARATAKRERLAKEEADRVEAEREAAAHHAARQEFYRSNHVFGTAGGSVAGTSDKFGADRARIGHRGEEVVGRRLDELVAARPDSWLFHDLKWPPTTNTRANIDHAVLVGRLAARALDILPALTDGDSKYLKAQAAWWLTLPEIPGLTRPVAASPAAKMFRAALRSACAV
ncbi:MAG: hypothetical protein M3Y35_14390 [Actinomycetota bacterium]|nr:hypothetical protein [Actinomycetota bacterium]